MNWSKTQVGMIGVALLGLARVASAQEFAKLPYEQIYQVEKVQVELTHTFTNLQVELRMVSTDLKVKSSDLDVFIAAKQARIPVKIGEDGSFSVPMRDDLRAEDPWIITNQPKGSMQLDWKVGLNARRMTNSMTYRNLMQPVKDCEVVQGKMRELFPGAPKLRVVGLKFTYETTPKVPVLKISTRGGERKLQPDIYGEIALPLETALLEENPMVSLQQMPAKVEIVTKRSEE